MNTRLPPVIAQLRASDPAILYLALATEAKPRVEGEVATPILERGDSSSPMIGWVVAPMGEYLRDVGIIRPETL